MPNNHNHSWVCITQIRSLPKTSKKSSAQWFCIVAGTILFLTHPFLQISLFFPSFQFQDISGRGGSGCEEGERKPRAVPQTMVALLSFRMLTLAFPNLAVAFSDKDTNPALQKWIVLHLKIKTVLSNYRYAFGLQRLQR